MLSVIAVKLRRVIYILTHISIQAAAIDPEVVYDMSLRRFRAIVFACLCRTHDHR